MNAGHYVQQALSLQKISLKNWQDSADFAQAQTFGTTRRILDLAAWLPKENTVALKKLQEFSTQALKRFNAYIDSTFSTYETLLATSPKQTVSKSKATQRSQADGKN